MSRYEIVSAKGQHNRPCAYLEYNLNHDEFWIAIEPWATERDVPMMFIPFLDERRVPSHWARVWVEMRTVPSGRQNLGEILRANHMGEYRLVELMELSEGRSSDDDFIVRPCTDDDRLHCVRQDHGEAEPVESTPEQAEKRPEETTAEPPPQVEEATSIFNYRGPSFCNYAVVSLGGAIRNARKVAGLTQNDLSEKTGIQQAMISRIEAGKANPTLETLASLAEGCGKRLRVTLE